MADFTTFNSTTHPIVKLSDDWNSLLDHGLEKTASYIIRKNGSYYECIKGGTSTGAGTIAFGGSGNAGAVSGTDFKAVYQAALNALTAGRSSYEKIVVKGSFTVNNPISIPAYTILNHTQAKFTCSASWTVDASHQEMFSGDGANIIILGGVIDGGGIDVHGIRGWYSNFYVSDAKIYNCGYNCLVAWAYGPKNGNTNIKTVRFKNIDCTNTDATGFPPISLTSSGDAFYVEDAVIEGCTVQDLTSEVGILIEGDVRDAVISNCNLDACQAAGIFMDDITDGTNPAGQPKNVTVKNCTTINNVGSGFATEGYNTVFDGCTSQTNGYDGFFVMAAAVNTTIVNCLGLNNGQGNIGGRENGCWVEAATNGVSFYNNRMTDNQTPKTQEWGIKIGATATRIRFGSGQDLYGNKTAAVSIDPTASILAQSVIAPFVTGTLFNDDGWDVHGGVDQAVTFFQLPTNVNTVLFIRVYAMTSATEADAMRLEILLYAGGSNEARNAVDVWAANHPSSTTNFTANDVVYWQVTAANDADVANLAAGQSCRLHAIYEGAGGADCATNAMFRAVEVIYV